MVLWSSVLTDRTAITVRVIAIVAATIATSPSSLDQALAHASAQVGAFLIARLLTRPPWLDVSLSALALFVAPFAPAFLLVPIVSLLVFLRRNTRWLTASSSTREMMTTVRELSGEGSLDPVAIARSLLEEVRRVCPCEAGSITVGTRTLATFGVAGQRDFVQALHIGDKQIGELVLSGVSLSPSALSLINEGSAKIETALLFTEARSAASSAERSRLARDMHDGVAQELTSVGYLIDELLVDAPEVVRPELRTVRNELTRVISDLRLSIFELRSTTTDSLSLGTALSDYVNQMRSSAPFRIHLSVDEGTERLNEDAEQELLRIVQEAVANSRRHSQAENLWITCQIRAPRALITIDDDGVGLQPSRSDSFGMNIMRERATQIGATVTLGNRRDGGTAVTIEVGG